MTKAEFIDQIASKAGLTKKDAGAAVEAVLGNHHRHAQERR